VLDHFVGSRCPIDGKLNSRLFQTVGSCPDRLLVQSRRTNIYMTLAPCLIHRHSARFDLASTHDPVVAMLNRRVPRFTRGFIRWRHR